MSEKCMVLFRDGHTEIGNVIDGYCNSIDEIYVLFLIDDTLYEFESVLSDYDIPDPRMHRPVRENSFYTINKFGNRCSVLDMRRLVLFEQGFEKEAENYLRDDSL